MPARSNPFQRLTYLVKRHAAPHATVTESKMLVDPMTGESSEVDICIEQTVGSHDIIVSLESTSTARPSDVGWVDQMKAKHDRLPTNKLVLVSQNGFTA